MKAIRYLLFPFAIIYDLITTIRNFFYDKGVFSSTEFQLPVIAVGNLSTGGTGKSPQIEYLIRLLKNDYKVAVLSRGYKRKTKGFIILNENHIAEDVGDEPLQFFSKFNEDIHVAVNANRTEGVQQLISKVNPDVILLDDAFQHRKVKAGYYILLTKFNDLYCDDFILPTGNLRESRRGSKRADVIIVTKCPGNLSVSEMNILRKKLNINKKQKLYFSTIDYNENLKGSKKISVKELKGYDLVLVTGIANPDSLLAYLKENNLNFTHINFPDHHNFSNSDISKIEKTFNAISSEKKMILTTEKDFMRLNGRISNLIYIAIETKFLADEKLFVSDITGFIKS
ncbi:tetraacyldisaccharide 4'-kinase [Tenacibaculum sp. ZS6-P6]|uniref:tetraacyldisaccharide 4'-kinase n=1 Tax=Tenacibaculum sp. ZS6-P6 TaxID=3447503 RepID=UPI003F9C50A9